MTRRKPRKRKLTPSDLGFCLPDGYWEPMRPGREIPDPLSRTGESWFNDKCQVLVYDHPVPDGWPTTINLSLKLNTREPWHDWRDFYRIKSELCGTSCWGFELYPTQDALVDTANQYHMFVLPPGVEFPIALQQPPVVDYSEKWAEAWKAAEKEVGKEELKEFTKLARQRPWHDHHKCDDLPLIGPVWAKRGYYIDDDGEIQHEEEEDG